MRQTSVVLLLLAAAVAAQAQRTCPIQYCARTASACVANSITSKWTCTRCVAPRVPSLTKTACVCPAGTYPAADGSCSRCKKDFYCPASTLPDKNTATRCPRNMVTINTGARSINNCVNAAGFYYKKTASGVAAIACPVDTYSLGLQQQQFCNPCPPGFKTDPGMPIGTQTTSAACVAPKGYYVNGYTVIPCPKGSFSDAYTNNEECTTCASLFGESGEGVTTLNSTSTSADECKVAEPGYALILDDKTVILTSAFTPATQNLGGAKLCPQNYYCPGGDATVEGNATATPPIPNNLPKACPNTTWTEGEGAAVADECVAPPGWSWNTTGLALTECPSGTYKDTWSRTGCLSCGVGYASDQTIRIDLLNPNTGTVAQQLAVRGASSSCYIVAGQGSVIETNGTNSVQLRAVTCPQNFYGVTNKTYGLTAFPCTACPVNMQTAALVGGVGYSSVAACLTQAGYGYYSGASQKCPQGYYNAGGNQLPCTQCPLGTTTIAPTTAGAINVAACNLYMPGYGLLGDVTGLCPIGTFHGAGISMTAACTQCTLNKWTPDVGATMDGPTDGDANLDGTPGCTLCAPGFGNETVPVNATTAPVCSACPSGYYGPATRTTTSCLTCSVTRSYSFNWDGGNTPVVDTIVPLAITTSNGAKTNSECVTDLTQVVEGPLLIEFKTTAGSFYSEIGNRSTMAACADYCRTTLLCAAFTFDYDTEKCYAFEPTTAGGTDAGFAWKTLPTLLVAESVEAKQFGSGIYSIVLSNDFVFNDTFAAAALDTGAAPAAAADLPTCQTLCDQNNLCVGFSFAGLDTTASPATITVGSCRLILGTVDPGMPQRSLTKATSAGLLVDKP